MGRVAVIYEEKNAFVKKAAEEICYMLDNGICVPFAGAEGKTEGCDGLCFVFSYYGPTTPPLIKYYMTRNRDQCKGKNIVLAGAGFSENGFARFVSDANKALEERNAKAVFIAEEHPLAPVCQRVARYYLKSGRRMDPFSLLRHIEAFINEVPVMALASSEEQFVRCTPVSFVYYNGSFYAYTRGGMKFRGILENKKVSGALFDPKDTSHERQLQFSGNAVIIPPSSEEFGNIMSLFAGRLPLDDGISRYLLKITPLRYEMRSKEFELMGFDAFQFMKTTCEKDAAEAEG